MPRGCRADAGRVPADMLAGVPEALPAGFPRIPRAEDAARIPRGCRAGSARVPRGCRQRRRAGFAWPPPRGV